MNWQQTALVRAAFRWVRLPFLLFQTKRPPNGWPFCLEQDTGVEPAFTAWEAVVLPIYESCGCEGIIAKLSGKFNTFLSSPSAVAENVHFQLVFFPKGCKFGLKIKAECGTIYLYRYGRTASISIRGDPSQIYQRRT